ASRDTLLPHDDDTCYNSESDLRCDKPEPVDVARKQRIEKLHDRVKQPRPQYRGNQTSECNRTPREHGKHRSIEQPYKDGADTVQDEGNRETVPVERIQLGRAQLKRFCVDSSGKEVDGIPDASGL